MEANLLRHDSFDNRYNTPKTIDAAVGSIVLVLITILLAYVSGAGLTW